MAMNREQRRYMQRQGQLDDEGNPVATRREAGPARPDRVTPREYGSEVASEMKRVIWPNRQEVINYTLVVLLTLVLVTTIVAMLDYVFAEGLKALLNAGSNN